MYFLPFLIRITKGVCMDRRNFLDHPSATQGRSEANSRRMKCLFWQSSSPIPQRPEHTRMLAAAYSRVPQGMAWLWSEWTGGCEGSLNSASKTHCEHYQQMQTGPKIFACFMSYAAKDNSIHQHDVCFIYSFPGHDVHEIRLDYTHDHDSCLSWVRHFMWSWQTSSQWISGHKQHLLNFQICFLNIYTSFSVTHFFFESRRLHFRVLFFFHTNTELAGLEFPFPGQRTFWNANERPTLLLCLRCKIQALGHGVNEDSLLVCL